MASDLILLDSYSPINCDTEIEDFLTPKAMRKKNNTVKSPKEDIFNKWNQFPNRLGIVQKNNLPRHPNSSKNINTKSPLTSQRKKIGNNGISHKESYKTPNDLESPSIPYKDRKKKITSITDYNIYKPRSKSDKKIIYKRLIATQKGRKILFNTDRFNILNKNKTPSTNLQKSLKAIQRNQGILKEFTNDFALFCSEVDYESTGYLKYTKFCNLLQKLGFIENSYKGSSEERELILKAWKLLSGMEINKINIDNLYIFLLTILNLNTKHMVQIPKSASNNQKSPYCRYTKLVPIKIHQEFYQFCINRMKKKEEKSLNSRANSLTEENQLSKEDLPEIILAEPQEKNEINSINSNKKGVIRKISLGIRDLSSTPIHRWTYF